MTIRNKLNAGFTLIELMIGMTVGLILMAGIITAFLSSKSVYATQQALSQIQETGRLALEFLENDIRMAGYLGCASRFSGKQFDSTLKEATDIRYSFSEAIQGFSDATLPNANKVFTQIPKENTDVLVLRSAIGQSVPVIRESESDQLFIKNQGTEPGFCKGGKNRVSGICPDDLVVVSDCTKARVFQVTSINASKNEAALVHSFGTGKPGNKITEWGEGVSDYLSNYGVGSEVMPAVSRAYFIATDEKGNSSLWRSTNGNDHPLLKGVEDIAFTYGEESSANRADAPQTYKPANEVTDWSRVVSVQVEILIASQDNNVLQEPQTVAFDNQTLTPEDRRLRRTFKNTIGIRSRLK